MPIKALDLFQAYAQGKLPKDGGYIASSFFNQASAYSIYEIVAYSTVNNLYLGRDGLSFQTNGYKLFVLVEPPDYAEKLVEPANRSANEQIPHRFSDLNVYTARDQSRIMVSRDPIITYSSFVVLKPVGMNFALIFYNREEVLDTLEFFFSESLYKEAGIPPPDAKKAAKYIIEAISKFTIR